MTEEPNDSLNDLFEVLSHEYRRYILWVLAKPDDRADAVIDTTQFTGPGGEPDILYLELIHNHLPKLDDYDLVDWNPETETLRRGPRFEEIEPFLDVMEDRDRIPRDWP